jgi:hypothetical protein
MFDGKCAFFPKTKVKEDEKDSYFYCSTAREFPDMCGEEGKYYLSTP